MLLIQLYFNFYFCTVWVQDTAALWSYRHRRENVQDLLCRTSFTVQDPELTTTSRGPWISSYSTNKPAISCQLSDTFISRNYVYFSSTFIWIWNFWVFTGFRVVYTVIWIFWSSDNEARSESRLRQLQRKIIHFYVRESLYGRKGWRVKSKQCHIAPFTDQKKPKSHLLIHICNAP